MTRLARVLAFVFSMLILLVAVLYGSDPVEEKKPAKRESKKEKEIAACATIDWQCVYRCYDAECVASCADKDCEECLYSSSKSDPSRCVDSSVEQPHLDRLTRPAEFFPIPLPAVTLDDPLDPTVQVVDVFSTCYSPLLRTPTTLAYTEDGMSMPIKGFGKRDKAFFKEDDNSFVVYGTDWVRVINKETATLDWWKDDYKINWIDLVDDQVRFYFRTPKKRSSGGRWYHQDRNAESAGEVVEFEPKTIPTDRSIEDSCYAELEDIAIIDGRIVLTDGIQRVMVPDLEHSIARIEPLKIPPSRVRVTSKEGVYTFKDGAKVIYNMSSYRYQKGKVSISLGPSFKQGVVTDDGLYFIGGGTLHHIRHDKVETLPYLDVKRVKRSSDGDYLIVVNGAKEQRAVSWFKTADRVATLATRSIPFEEKVDDVDLRYIQGANGEPEVELIYLAEDHIVRQRSSPYDERRIFIETLVGDEVN